ncbi:hypothetical protein GOC83_19385 [Haloarcula rubripromontorii]|uniref:Uncharacterized protein n=1 Tax=Haloarcula rubripromontorii TaxID=1705562 RepID=A0A847UAP0_9EURY|nr:hypothetical protein [Haloarcula rubripromontorii]NLV08284.1 hypothetical protein [Haloarcula rubripromontorii]
MSTSDLSIPRPPATESNVQSLLAMAVETIVSVFQGVAFWASIPLPLVIAGTLATNVVAAQPLLVGGLVVLNIACAILGHNYSPGA